jgi:hypothetical protein
VSEPVRVGELLPGVLGEVVDRAGPGYERWAELVAQAGYCHHPIRLAGRVEQADRQTGEVRTIYDSEREPDGVLLKACGTRRESRCPSCAAVYRADAYQLLAAGLKGGKGVPETVARHPRLFVTFTAPGFGKVHSRDAKGRLVLPCHPHRQGARCPHGRRAGCWHRHDEDDPRLGEPLCVACYDAEAQVLWNALAPELWRRTTIALHRALAREVGVSEVGLRRLVRVSYAKVAEFQRRGAIHFHAVIRLDAATACRCPDCLLPPPEPFTADLLEDSLKEAVPAVRVPCPPLEDGGPGRYARWGEQLDVHNITGADVEAGELSAEQVASYIAKYATKATESFGSGLDRRLHDGDLEHLDGLPAHIGELVRAAAAWRRPRSAPSTPTSRTTLARSIRTFSPSTTAADVSMPSGWACCRGRLAVPIDRLASISLQRLRSHTGPLVWWRPADPPCETCPAMCQLSGRDGEIQRRGGQRGC